MPKIDTPDVRKGFWLTVGVMLAFLLLAIIRMIMSAARRGKRGG
jgi:hypothetical protein